MTEETAPNENQISPDQDPISSALEPNVISDVEIELTTEDLSVDRESIKESSPEPVQEETVEENKEDKEKNPNAYLTWSCELPYTPNLSYNIAIPSSTARNFERDVVNSNRDNLANLSKEDREAINSLDEESGEAYSAYGLYQKRFFEDRSEFTQGVITPDEAVKGISSVNIKTGKGELKGEVAILKMSRALGMGDVVNVPLVHTGMWVTIKPPTEREIVDFYNLVNREKPALGRLTYGLTFSNYAVYVNERLFDFVLSHIHSTNYNDIEKKDLKKYISIADFPVLIWGLSCAMFPNGFNYRRRCTGPTMECTHIVEGVINLTKLLWVDNKSLTKYQREVMAENRPNRLTKETYDKYQQEFQNTRDSLITINDELKLVISLPTFDQYITDGLGWVSSINNVIDQIIVQNDEDEKEVKSETLNMHIRASALRQFNHFVKKILIGNNTVVDRETINALLETFSSDDDIRTKVNTAIVKYKEEATIAIIGVPDYKCPSCSHGQVDPNTSVKKFTTVIPVDVLSVVFFNDILQDIQDPGPEHVVRISSVEFGSGYDFDAFINDLFDNAKLTKDYILNKQFILELYETTIGIYDHRQSINPLGSVLQHPTESYINGSMYNNYLTLFMNRRIRDVTGLSFDEFIDRPRYEIEMMVKAIEDHNNRKDSITKKNLSNMDSDVKSIKKNLDL